MKFNLKKIIAAAAAFACSLTFCLMVLCGDKLFNEETSDDKNAEMMQTSVESDEERPVIVIDPGHGGMDGGASSVDGTLEKDINLEIALKLKEIAEEYPVDVVMTRENDVSLHTDDSASIRNQKRQDLLRRKEIIQEADADLAVSIHLNSFPSDQSVYGAQVFYPKDDVERTDGRTSEHNSKEYAESIQKSIELNISDGRERSIMTKDDFLVFEDPTCPMVLIECGFLSNVNECEKLKTREYQEKVGVAIWEGINEILCLEKAVNIKIVDSANKRQKK